MDEISPASIWRRQHRLYRWLLLVVSSGLFGWVLWRANLSELWRYLSSADYGLLVGSIPIALVGLMLRAIRWRVLLLPLGNPSIGVSFGSMMLGYLGNNLLPMRAGEVLRAYVLGRQTSISKSAVLATIVVERVVDGVVMILALSLLFLVFPVPHWLQLAVVGGGVVFSGATVALIMARRRPKGPVDIFRFLLSRLPNRWQSKGTSLVDNFLLGLTAFRSYKDALSFLLLTLMVWATEVLLFWVVMCAFHISLPVLAITFVVAAGAVSTAIPASPGYVGTYEFVLVSVLTLLGVLIAPATAFTVGIHGLAWATVNIVGAVCAFQLGISLRATYEPILVRKA
jgi:glycosyltransferase 2 family protein